MSLEMSVDEVRTHCFRLVQDVFKPGLLSSREGSKTVANRDYLLWSVVSASTAAPTCFEPESVLIKEADPSADLREVRGESSTAASARPTTRRCSPC